MKGFVFVALTFLWQVNLWAADRCKYDSGRQQFTDAQGNVITLIFESHMNGEAVELFNRQMTEQRPLKLASVEEFIAAHPHWPKVRKIEQDLRAALTRRADRIGWIAAESPKNPPFAFDRIEDFSRFIEKARIPDEKIEIARAIYFGADAAAWHSVEREKQTRKIVGASGIVTIGVDTGRDPAVDKRVAEKELAFVEYTRIRNDGGSLDQQIETLAKLDQLTRESDAAMMKEFPRRQLVMAQNLLKEMSVRSAPGFALLGYEHGRGVVVQLEKLCKDTRSQPPLAPRQGQH